MSKIEQAGYPYIEGSHGIPFDKAVLSRKRNDLIGGSGRVLNCYIDPQEILVTDAEDVRLMLVSLLSPNGELRLGLHSRLKDGSAKHPDLFAARFVDFTIRNFELLGGNIRFLVGAWEPGSDNYRQFFDHLNSSQDRVAAARSTWTGQIAERHGFSLTDESSISWNPSDTVIVRFQR